MGNVKAAGVTVTSGKGDICSASKCALPAGTGSVDFHGVACPLAAGDVSLDFDVTVSKFVPSSLAHLDIEMSAEGSAGKLICAKLSTTPGAVGAANGNAALDVIEGLAKGLFDDETLSNCIQNVAETVPAIGSSFQEVLAALKSKKPLKIIKAIKNLRQELKNVPQELQDCGANIQDVEDLLKELKEAIPAIVGEIVAARNSLDQGNYEDFGEHTGKTLTLLMGHAPTANQYPGLGANGDPAFDFIVGLSDGLFNDHTFSECVANALQTIPDAKSALADLVSALKSKNPLHIIKAIKELKAFLHDIPDSLKVCSDNLQEVEDLLSELGHIVYSQIHDIAQAFDSLKSHDYEGFGEYTGKALRMVVYGDKPRVASVVV